MDKLITDINKDYLHYFKKKYKEALSLENIYRSNAEFKMLGQFMLEFLESILKEKK